MRSKEYVCVGIQQGLDALKAWVVPVARKMHVNYYIRKIRSGADVCYRNAVADFWEEFFSEETYRPMKNDLAYRESQEEFWEDASYPYDPLTDFGCYNSAGSTITSFHFGRKLELDTNIWMFSFDNPSGWYDDSRIYFRLSDTHAMVTVRMCIHDVDYYPGSSGHGSNILLVLRCLNEEPKTRKQIAREIHQRYYWNISEKTIGTQIAALQDIGFPIFHRNTDAAGIIANARSFAYLYGDVLRDPDPAGFYLDWSKQKPVQQEKVQQLGTRAYPLLILLTLQSEKDPMKPSQIREAVLKRYGVNISKGAIGRNMKLLEQLAYIQESDKKGYFTAEGNLLPTI